MIMVLLAGTAAQKAPEAKQGARRSSDASRQ
jgi:hypothetical protein